MTELFVALNVIQPKSRLLQEAILLYGDLLGRVTRLIVAQNAAINGNPEYNIPLMYKKDSQRNVGSPFKIIRQLQLQLKM